MEQPQIIRSSVAEVFVDSLDYTNVELHNFGLSGTTIAPASTGVALRVVGGPLAQQGTPQYGRTSLFAGSLSDNYISFQASNGASLHVRDAWYELNNASTWAQVSNNSSFTGEGSRIAVPTGNGDAIQISNFSCNAALLASAPDSNVSANSGSGSIWVLGSNFGSATSYFNNLAVDPNAYFNFNRYSGSDGSTPIADTTGVPAAASINTLLAQSRGAHPSVILDLPDGITDARFYRISIQLGTIGIHLQN